MRRMFSKTQITAIAQAAGGGTNLYQHVLSVDNIDYLIISTESSAYDNCGSLGYENNKMVTIFTYDVDIPVPSYVRVIDTYYPDASEWHLFKITTAGAVAAVATITPVSEITTADVVTAL